MDCDFDNGYSVAIVNFAEAEAATTAGAAASSFGDLGHWVTAVLPHKDEDGKRRVLLSCVLAVPAPTHMAAPECAALIWGIAPDDTAPWQEPPAGWHTQPANSWDVGKGAWGTKADHVGAIVSNGSRLSVFRTVLDLPWKGSLRKESGLGFKWQLGDHWLGDGVMGANLLVRTSYAKAWHSRVEGACSHTVLRLLCMHVLPSSLPSIR
jgi:hypothetical protein